VNVSVLLEEGILGIKKLHLHCLGEELSGLGFSGINASVPFSLYRNVRLEATLTCMLNDYLKNHSTIALLI